MAKLKRWVKRLRCWLTGGHTYAGELYSEHFPKLSVTCFYRQCLKCGYYRVYAVADEALHSTYPLPSKVEVDLDG